MPEGHTIHRLARDQRRDLGGGATVRASSPQGRFADGAARIDGARLARTEAWGKHLFHTYDTGDVLHVHLGLIGVFARRSSPPPAPIGLVRLRLEGPSATWDLSGPNVCALIDPSTKAARIARLGPDPLRPDADPERFVTRVLRSKAPIGTLLLDQAVIAGVGNVYRAEVLWALGIHPDREGRSLDAHEVHAMWSWLAEALKLGVRRNRIVTIDPADLGKPVRDVKRGEGVWIYHQEVCRRCGSATATTDTAGRRIEFCPHCQT